MFGAKVGFAAKWLPSWLADHVPYAAYCCGCAYKSVQQQHVRRLSNARFIDDDARPSVRLSVRPNDDSLLTVASGRGSFLRPSIIDDDGMNELD